MWLDANEAANVTNTRLLHEVSYKLCFLTIYAFSSLFIYNFSSCEHTKSFKIQK